MLYNASGSELGVLLDDSFDMIRKSKNTSSGQGQDWVYSYDWANS